MPKMNKILEGRKTTYGTFTQGAQVSQNLKAVIRAHPKFMYMTMAQREALEMIMGKISRIINGDPDYADSWVDVAGYAQLIVNDLTNKKV